MRPNTTISVSFEPGKAVDGVLDPLPRESQYQASSSPQMRSNVLHSLNCTIDLHARKIYLRRAVVVQVRVREVSVNCIPREETATLSTKCVVSGQHRIHVKKTREHVTQGPNQSTGCWMVGRRLFLKRRQQDPSL